jgi:hypothetical protein
MKLALKLKTLAAEILVNPLSTLQALACLVTEVAEEVGKATMEEVATINSMAEATTIMAVKEVVAATMAVKVITIMATSKEVVTSNAVVAVTVPMTVVILISHVSFVERQDIQCFVAAKIQEELLWSRMFRELIFKRIWYRSNLV